MDEPTIAVLASNLTTLSSCCFSQPYLTFPCVPIGNFFEFQTKIKYHEFSFLFLLKGIFWDIENIRLPQYKSAMGVVEALRRRFLKNYREAEFLVVCDVRKERKQLVTDLNNAQVFVWLCEILFV